jgi:rhamnose utilization protein RhaD (predicted bifunctional aldolase and dehydrogenase)
MNINKDRAVFWLNRRIKTLEFESSLNHEAMAQAGMSYGDRQAMLEKQEKLADDNKGELATLKEILAFVQEKA